MFKNVRKEMMTIPAQMSYLSQVRDFIERIGKRFKYSDKIVNSFKLVVDEACTNVIRHGYRDIKGGEITIKAIIRRQSLTIVLIDQGTSYDPRQANTPDLHKYINIGKKGGLGIFMMRKLMDDVQYNITSRGNELRLTKTREVEDTSRTRQMWDNLKMRTRYTLVASTVLTIVLGSIFFFNYSSVYDNEMEALTTTARGLSLSFADNSRDALAEENDLTLFMQARSLKNNNPEMVYEAFITNLDGDIQARSTPLKEGQLGRFEMPDVFETLEDTTKALSIFKYNTDDQDVFDFVADIFSDPTGGQLIGKAHVQISVSYIDDLIFSAKIRIIILFVVLMIISYVGSYFLIDRIVTPFHSLADWVQQVGQGTVDEDEIDIDASDELGEIAQAFNSMTTKFRQAQVNLIEQQRLQKELQVAQEIQQMLLPSDFPQVEGYDIASFYEAAKEVGGDLFDFVEVDEDTIGICVADVAGKGVPGSLIMTMIRTALRLEARGNKNPAEVLSKVNRFVTDDMKRGMFVTMFYIVLDSRNRIIHYASAGHNPMILYRGSTKQTYFLNPSGFPVGIQLPDISLFDRKIESDSIRLREDDMLVLYTDGITEAMNTKRELYREERFMDAIRNNSHYDVAEFVKLIKQDVKNHTQGYPQNDDITYVAIKEKLMPGEVIYNIHRELFRLIEEEGVKVKDACEKMRVSQYMYRKSKQIKNDVGLEGLKDSLFQSDYIEKKHLSIEMKTKMLEVIRRNPEYGAKRICAELNTEPYGFVKIDQHRIYEELKKAKLNTKQKRISYLQRGGNKKRIKLPGTPLLTMDGQVILNFESSEKHVAQQTGSEIPEELKPVETASQDEASKTVEIASANKDDSVETGEAKDEPEAVVEHEEVIEEPEVSVEPDTADSDITETDDEKPEIVDTGIDEPEDVKIAADSGHPADSVSGDSTGFVSLDDIAGLDDEKEKALEALEKEKVAIQPESQDATDSPDVKPGDDESSDSGKDADAGSTVADSETAPIESPDTTPQQPEAAPEAATGSKGFVSLNEISGLEEEKERALQDLEKEKVVARAAMREAGIIDEEAEASETAEQDKDPGVEAVDEKEQLPDEGDPEDAAPEQTPIKDKARPRASTGFVTLDDISTLEEQKPGALSAKEKQDKELKEMIREADPQGLGGESSGETDRRLKTESTEDKHSQVFSMSGDPVKEKDLQNFYRMINDDISVIDNITSGWNGGSVSEKDLSKISLTLKIMSRNPMLHTLGRVKQLFELVQNGIEYLKEHADNFESQQVILHAKEQLKYLEKENIFNNSDQILKQINEVGILQHQIENMKSGNIKADQSDIDKLRKKIADKKILKNVEILESISKTDKK